MAGALKTLYGALGASSFLSGVTLYFGEEYINAQEGALPYIAMVPIGGPIDNNPGYAQSLDPNTEMIWGVRERIEFYIWGADTNPQATPVDHADVVETLRMKLLSALQDQKAQYSDVANVAYGLVFYPGDERWATDMNAAIRYGRCLIVPVVVEISVPMSAPSEATITTVTTTVTV